jgi:hypothetical protein
VPGRSAFASPTRGASGTKGCSRFVQMGLGAKKLSSSEALASFEDTEKQATDAAAEQQKQSKLVSFLASSGILVSRR